MVESAVAAGVGSSLIFVILNVAMNLYTKWLFAPDGGDFAFPWTMLAVQQVQAYMVLQPWIAIKYPTNRCGWDMGDGDEGLGWSFSLQVLAVTSLFCLNVGLNSLSLVRISITLNQTVRAFLPVGVLLLATVLERRTYPRHSYVTTAVLILGIALTCWGSPNFELCGFLLALLSTVVAAVGSSINGRLLSAGPFSKAGPEKIARLMLLQSVPAFFIFSGVAALTEGPALRASLRGLGFWGLHRRLALVSVSSVLALTSNLGRCFLVAATSALMETLAGNAKVAALCVIDHALFHTSLHAHNYAGIALTFSGFSVHVLLQYASRPTEAPPAGPRQEAEALSPATKGSFHGLAPRPGPAPPHLSLPRMISGAETGLASEHLALRLGKPAPRGRRRRWQAQEEEEEPGAAPGRRRAGTWQAGTDPTRAWLERVGTNIGMDLAPVIEAPPWLSDEASEAGTSRAGSTDEWEASLGFTPRGARGEKEDSYEPLALPPLPNQSSRSRIWSDITHSAGNPRPL